MARLILIYLSLWIPKSFSSCVKSNDACIGDWTQFNGEHYHISPGLLDWSQADGFCRKIGGDLLQVLSRNARMFLEKTYEETGEMYQTWWVGQHLLGRLEESPEPIWNDSEFLSRTSSEMERTRGDPFMLCNYVIMDPEIQLVTSSSCQDRRNAICMPSGALTNSYDVIENLPTEQRSVRHSHKILKRSITPYQLDAGSLIQQLISSLENETTILSMSLHILEMEEIAKIHLNFQQKLSILRALMNATVLIAPEAVNSTRRYKLILKCAAAISLISRSQCEGEDAQQTKMISALMIELLQLLSMQLLKTGNGPMTVQHPTVTIYLARLSPEKLDNFVIGIPGNDTQCHLPSYNVLASKLGDQAKVNLEMFSFELNPLRGDSNETITNKICGLSLKDDKSKEIRLQNLSETVEILMPRHDAPAVEIQNMTVNNKTVLTTTINVPDPMASVIFHMEPSKPATFQLLLAYQRRPNISDFDHSTILSNATGYRWLITPEMLNESLGNWSVQVFPINYTQGNESIELEIMSFMTKCMFWDTENETWSIDGCQVGLESEPHQTQCLCNHLTFFGSSVFVMPNEVDLTQTSELFARVHENYVVVVMLSVFFGVYLILLAWAIYADRRAFIKKKMTLLADNHPCAQYYYLVNVQTGHRRGAGTSAQVEFTLMGTEGQSTRRHFTDPQKPCFERGGVDIFLLATPFPLGDMESIRIRHDNSGKSPDWYLDRVTIQDMQLRKHWHFLCSTWLSSSKGDGNIKKTFRPADINEINSFRNLFQTRTYTGFRDEHIWVSVVDPPRRSPFTRAQRVSCCMCLLLCTMAINIMFWNRPDDKHSPVIFNIGSLEVTWEDIIIGVESGLLMFPINILIITIFRSIRPRLPKSEKDKNDGSQNPRRGSTAETFLKDTEELMTILSRSKKNQVPTLEKNVDDFTFDDLCNALTSLQGLQKLMQGLGEDNEDNHWVHCSHFVMHFIYHLESILGQTDGGFPSQEDFQWVQNTLTQLRKKAEAMYSTLAPMGLNTAPTEKKKSECWLPWWFVFVGWFLLFAISGISTFFTLLYGFVYGKESSTQWAISLALSLFQSIFILQPLKVVGLAIILALILKKVTVDESGEVAYLLKEQKERCRLYSHGSPP